MKEHDKPLMSPKVEEEIQGIIDVLEEQQEKEKVEQIKLINSWITLVGCDHEVGDRVVTTQRFGIAIFLAMQLFEGITWNEITNAYKSKSKVNIDRQNGGY